MPDYQSLIRAIESPDRNLPQLHSGDTVKVHVRIIEGNRERIQVFQGMVIRLRGGSQGETFTVRRVANGVGVERTFLLRSPRLDKIELIRSGKVRRAQLYYMRGLSGKASRLKERRFVQSGGVSTPHIVSVEVPNTDTDGE